MQERENSYNALIAIASILHQNNIGVVLDATAHKSAWRDKLRELVGKDFVEVYVRCKPEIAMKRETKRSGNNLVRRKLYFDALKRLRSGKKVRGLGVVPGVDVPYEEPRRPELVVDSDRISVEECARQIVSFIRRRK
jgi:adenylylsulfate kinase